ncbi:MAG: hypothetical protein AABY22_07060, partial [Nanoarchaeota archaeon]
EPGDAGHSNSYVHCIYPQQDPNSDSCVCGHSLSDHEDPSELAYVYGTDGDGEEIPIRWPNGMAFLGNSLGFDIFDGQSIRPIRFKKRALVLFAPDRLSYAIIAGKGDRVYVVEGGEMVVGPQGIEG